MSLAVLSKYPGFRAYALGSFVSLVGMWAQRIGLGWLVWDQTDSLSWLGLLAMADALPVVALSILGGKLSDVWDPLRVARWTIALSSLATLALVVVVTRESVSLVLVFLLVATNAIASALGQPARMVFAPTLVDREDVPAAVAIGALSFNVARLVGPVLSGVLLMDRGIEAAVMLNALTYVALWCVLMGLSMGSQGTSRARGRAAGAALTLRDACQIPFVASALSLTGLIAVTVRCYFDLLPGITGANLGAGPVMLAWLSSAAALGAIIGGAWMVSAQDELVSARRLLGSGLVAAGAMLVLAFADSSLAAAGCVATLGGGLVISATAAQSLIQLRAPVELRGRVMGMYLTLLRGGPALGALFMGVLADAVSLTAALLLGGITAAIGLGLVALRTGPMMLSRSRVQALGEQDGGVDPQKKAESDAPKCT